MDTETFEGGPHGAYYLPSPALKQEGSPSEKENDKTSTRVDIVSIEQQDTGTLAPQAINTDDPFPIDPDAPVEEYQFTLRAAIVGCGLGAVIAASNVYLGLKACHFAIDKSPPLNLMTPDWLDLRSVPFRRNIWLRNSKTPVDGPSELPGRWLLWTQGEQCRAGSCNISRIPWITLYLRFSSRLSIGTASSISKPRHWPSVHIHDLLRLFWTGVFHSTPQVLHPQVEARLPDRRCGCVYYSIIACR